MEVLSWTKSQSICPLYVHGHDMNLYKVMQAQANPMKGTWFYAWAKNWSDDGEELNTSVASAVAKAMKITKKKLQKDSSESEDD